MNGFENFLPLLNPVLFQHLTQVQESHVLTMMTVMIGQGLCKYHVDSLDVTDVYYLRKTLVVDRLLDDRGKEFKIPNLRSKKSSCF